MARLIGTSVFDPLGDAVGKVHDVVVLLQMRGEPRAVGFVIEVSSRRRVFLPLSRITAIEPGAVITTGLMNIRRFTQRHVETLVVGELLDRVVTMRDGSGNVTVRDVAIERDRGMDWKVTRLFVQRASSGPLGLRRGATFTVRPDEVSGLAASADQQGATPAEQALGEARDGKHRHREQHVLGNQESQGRRKDPIDRTEERQDRVKVVPEEVVARTFDGNDGRLEARVCLDGLGEDAQVPGRGDERAPLRHRVAHVERADRAGDEGGQPPGHHQATDG